MQTATYKSGPMFGLTKSFPTIGRQNSIYLNNPPPPLRRSFTTLPWRPSTYYQSSKVNPSQPLIKRLADPLSMSSQMNAMDPLKVPPIFQSARNALYTRYTPKDWECSNQTNYYTSDYLRNGAERLRLDTMRMCKEADDKTKKTQSDVGKRLGERINNIVFWKNELLRETDDLLTETAALTECKRMVEKALQETENPLNIAQECLYNREKRQGIDLVHDTPEKVLLKEVETIKKCQDKFRNLIDKANAQLSLNRAAQHELEKDTGDKFTAQSLDENAFQLRNTSRGINFHNGSDKIDNTCSIPESWCMFTNTNIRRSQSERSTSKHLRNEIDMLLNTCCNDMWHQWNSTNQSLTDRIKETLDNRNMMQTHLSKVFQEIFDMNKNIELIKSAIQDKQAPLQVAHTRLDTRLRRPNVESCKDSAHIRLVEEVSEIHDTLESLRKKLRQAEDSLQELFRLKTKLEEELAVKNNTLFIDREKCLAMRKTFPMAPICGVRIYT